MVLGSHKYTPAALRALRLAFPSVFLFGTLSGTALQEDTPSLASADTLYASRAQGHPGDGTAQAEPIRSAIEQYEQLLAQEPNNLELRNRLLRALFFAGEYTPSERQQSRGLFERGRAVFEQGLEQRARQHRTTHPNQPALHRLAPETVADLYAADPELGELYFWGGVHWGLWGHYFGTLRSARRGVPGKIRRYAEVAGAFDETFEGAGPLRMLGRLHTLSPRIPLFTGWVDRNLAVRFLEQAMAVAPDEPLNPAFLAEALDRRGQPGDKDRARTLRCELQWQEPRKSRAVEDSQAFELARQALGTRTCNPTQTPAR